MTAYIMYSTNNSGGSWWLKDKDWEALEKAGWIVHWSHDINATDHKHFEPYDNLFNNHHHAYIDNLVPCIRPQHPNDHRFLGALATSAAVTVGLDGVYLTPDAACDDFETLTSSNLDDSGCNCCGSPHSMTYHDADGEDHYLESRPRIYERCWE